VFRIEGLEAGTYGLTDAAGVRGAVAHRQTIELDADRELGIDLVAASVAGRLVDATTGEPLPRAEVRLMTPGDDPLLLHSGVDHRPAWRLSL
jgi:hypothetical protein